MTDIYNRDDWNFVFGLADLRSSVGVFSFARYDQCFFNSFIDDDKLEYNYDELLYAACKVMSHEILHMFSMKHCIFYEYNINGSMSAQESAGRTARLCPICLKKMQFNHNFNMLDRYKALKKVCENEGF